MMTLLLWPSIGHFLADISDAIMTERGNDQLEDVQQKEFEWRLVSNRSNI